jgi:autotransporter translocation and assembly factor TamB
MSEVKSQIRLNGPSNDLEGNILYSIDTKDIVGKFDLSKFELKLLDPFLTEIISNSNGFLKGEVDITGNIKSPEILGRVDLENISTTVVPNNTRYKIEKHSINFNKRSIDLGRVKIYDENNNEATLFGKIYHRKLNDVLLDLRLYSSKFRFLSTAYNDNPVFNGQMVLRSNMSITGPPELLTVNLSATTLDGTDITLSPFASTNSIIKESFIRYGNPQLENEVDKYLLQIARKYPFKVNIELEANENAKLNFIIDPISGDKITGVGSGNLIIKLNPDGEQEIFGKYTVESGTYNFSYGDFVKKKFVINNGGTINFNGNPLEARLDIQAIYNVNTTTYELIRNDFSIDESEVAASKRRSNVQVFLSLNGSLDAPLINLDIKVPELESSNLLSSIERNLADLRADPNLLNNQVFGLLIFDSFLLPNSASNTFNNFGNNLALSSISNLISSQLNNLARNAIKGVDLSVNVNSYETEYTLDAQSRNITELGLKVSKQLFNDRLKVTAGGNVDLQNDESIGTYSSFIGDFVLEYNLTEDGRYRIRVFSKSNYDGLLDENSSKNGVGLFFNKSFDDKTDGKK